MPPVPVTYNLKLIILEIPKAPIMKKIYLAVITVISSLLTHAQAAKSMYFELGVPGLASINFDTRF